MLGDWNQAIISAFFEKKSSQPFSFYIVMLRWLIVLKQPIGLAAQSHNTYLFNVLTKTQNLLFFQRVCVG